MAKITLIDLTSGYNAVNTINSNQDLVETAIENTLSRDGTGPNQMDANLDMNSNRIINLPDAVNNSEPVTLSQAASIQSFTGIVATQGALGEVLYPISAAETAASKTPTNYFHEYSNVLRFGTNTTPGTTVMDTAIQDRADVVEQAGGGKILIPQGDYKKTAAIDLDSDDLTTGYILEGEGSNTAGTYLINTTNDVAAIYVDGDIADQSTTRLDRVVMKDFRIQHEAATKYAIVAEEAPYLFLDNIKIECGSTGFGGIFLGSTTVIPDSDNFLSSFRDLDIRNYTDFGIRINSKGHTFHLHNCKVGGSTNGGVAGYFNTEGVHVDGGQWTNTGTGGSIGLYWYNLGAGDIESGSARNIKFEGIAAGEYGISIDGDTNAWISIYIENVGANLTGNPGTVVYFGRAKWCKYVAPAVRNPTGGGTLCEWGENSIGCELVCDYNAATAPITVHASATRAVKRVTSPVSRSQVANVTTAANLTTILESGVDDLPPGFVATHNGTAWNNQLLTIADDAATSFTPPADRGRLKLYTNGGLTFWGEVYYDADSTTADCDLKHTGGDLEAATGALTGTTGTDIKVTVSAHTDGLLYIENRSGATLKFTVLMEPQVWL